MTMMLPSSLQQPSKIDYLNALKNRHDWPFKLRARVINVYRKLMRPVAQIGRAAHVGLKHEKVVGSNPTRASKAKPRLPKNPPRFKKGDSGKKNSIVVYGFKSVVHINSTGKNRPTRKLKRVMSRRRVKYTLWLKGNKHNGGQHIGFD